MSSMKAASLPPLGTIMKPPSAPTPAIARRIRASLMCWPKSATKRALKSTGAKAFRIVRCLHCRIAGTDNPESLCAGALERRRKGFQDCPVTALPYRGDGPPVSLLLLVSSVGGNIPTRHLLDDRVFQTFVVVPEFYDLKVPLPAHQVVFNAIG